MPWKSKAKNEAYAKSPHRIAWLREWAKRPEVIRRRHNNALLREYGISVEYKEAMFAKQEGLCAICRKPLINFFSAHVDHNHETGMVRGLLHKQCNSLVAYFERDGQLFEVLKAYLEADNAME